MSTNNSEEAPAYLTVGTEVSAKFKGAFCEAKIKRVEKQVVCKITLKCNNTQVTLDEEVLKTSTGQSVGLGELKSGSVVYVQSEVLLSNGVELSKADLKQSINDLHAAILNKVNDKSVYSVIFNDGDERSLKRSFIRFKGEKHFHDSETLNNAPLNNPEHFLFPIKINTESENEPLSIGKTALNSVDSSKSASNMQLNEDEKALISSNKNSDHGENAESVDNNEDDDEDCSSSDSSDEYPAEVKDRFVAELYKFMDDRGTPMNKIPAVNKVDLDLHRLYTIVRKFGGYNRVTKQRNWNDVYKKLGLPNASNASHVLSLKSAYERYLQPYEEIYRKLGSSICDTVSRHHTSSSSNSTTFNKFDSHRLFKTRYLATPTSSSNNNSNNRKNPSRSKQSKQQLSSSSELNKDEKPSTPSSEIKEEHTADGESTKELTLASLINSRSLSPCGEDEQEQNEELTLVGMVKTLNENYKKAKKEKESDKKLTTAEDSEDQASVTNKSGKKSSKLNDDSSSLKEEKLNKNNKRPLSTSSQLRKAKSRTASLDKLKADKYSSEEDEEEKIESKTRRKIQKTDDTSVSKSNNSASKRKYSSNDNNDSNEKESQDANMDTASIETNTNETDENECKSIMSFADLEVNKLIDVYYGSNSQKHQYKAKIVQLNTDNQTVLVHYLGWNIRYDEWIKMDRIVRLFNEESSASKRRKPSKSNNGNQNNYENQSSPKETTKQQENANNNNNGKSKSNANGKLNNRSSSSSSSSSTTTTNETVTDSSTSINKIETDEIKLSDSISLTSQEKSNEQEDERSTDNKPMLLSIKEEIIESDQELIEKAKTESNNSAKRANSLDAKSSTEEIPTSNQTSNETQDEKANAKKKSFIKSNNSTDNLEIVNTNSNTNSPQQTKSESQLNETSNTNGHRTPLRINSTEQASKQNEANNSRRNSKDSIIQENKAHTINASLTSTTVINPKNDEISPNLQTNESINKSTITNPTQPESKYSFHIINSNLIGKQRIKQIEEQMKLCRETYTKLKMEIAAIDRKKKKLYQQRKEKSTTEDPSTVPFI